MLIYTAGHSNHPIEKFLSLLKEHDITAVADVRSQPFSRRFPQFNKERLSATLKQLGIAYVFLGQELGARSEDDSCYEDGQVRYGRLAATTLFKQGIDRVVAGALRFRVALMCAEKEPLDCHRTLLVSRALEQRGASIAHILADGSIETHSQVMTRLLRITRREDLEEACRLREQKIAYKRP
jgi:uncharacterized protein (DUF488 family)